MAGSQVSKSVAIDWFINAAYGFEAVTIDEYDTDNEPEVQAGSKLEINGDIYLFSSAEAITGWGGISNSTQAYIKFVPSGSSVTVEFTSTAPTWSDSKQGWYGTGGTANDRYLYRIYKDGSGNYTNKNKLFHIERMQIERRKIGDWDMTAINSVSVAHGLGSSWNKIIHMSTIIRNDSDDKYTNLSSMTTVSNGLVNGGTEDIDSTNILLFRYTSGAFNVADYNSTSYNRGWIMIGYYE